MLCEIVLVDGVYASGWRLRWRRRLVFELEGRGPGEGKGFGFIGDAVNIADLDFNKRDKPTSLS